MMKRNKKQEPEDSKVSLDKLKLKCDLCKHEFKLEQNSIESEMLDNKVEWRHFSCPNCNKRYTTYIGNTKVENYIDRRNAVQAKIRIEVAKGQFMNQKRYLGLMGEDAAIAKKIKKVQAKLKEVYSIGERELERVSKES